MRRGPAAVAVSIVGMLCVGRAEAARLSDLPPTTEGRISALIGQDQVKYHARAHAGGVRFANPAHGLVADFDRESVRVRAGAARWGLSLVAYGDADAPRPAAAAAPSATRNRVEYSRGALTEWYVNGPLGIEQGFTIASRPGADGGAPLRLTFALSGNVVPSVEAGGRDLTLRGRDGTGALRYRGLMAEDADGRALRAWLEVEPGRLHLDVDDAGARYPLTVDPFIEQARLFASDGAASDIFGVAVALDGDTLVVGAPADDVDGRVDQGSAYVFVKPAAGWTGTLVEAAKLTASDGVAGDVFGSQIAMEGDTIVIGAPGNSPATPPPGTTPIRGAAYVFVKPAGGWSGHLNESAKLTATDGSPNDRFGDSVGISGDVIVVGAAWDDFFRGSVYVFVKPAGGWAGPLTQRARLIASDRAIGGGIGDVFGAAAAIHGDTIVVGALGKDSPAIDSGAAYVFVEPATGWLGTFTENAKLVASDTAFNDRLGWAIDVRGDTVVVGAPFDDATSVDQGSAYVYVKPAGGWSGTRVQHAKLVASDPVTNARYGHSAVLNDELVVVGALAAPGATAAGAGAAYRYQTPAAGWSGTLTETGKLTGSDGASGDEFGCRVALDGDTLLVGARRDDVGGMVDRGSAYVFSAELPPPALVTLSPPSAVNPVGTLHTVIAAVTDAFGNPTANVTVRFAIGGAVTTSGSCLTDAGGQCAVSYPGPTAPGADTILAFADTDGDGAQDADEPAASATKTWIAGPPATVTVTPAAATNPVGTEHCVSAAAADSYGNPTAGVLVRFAVTGSVVADGDATTDAAGEAPFCYTGPDLPGADEITAHADTDGDAVVDPGEPVGAATNSWLLPESTPGQASGAGHVRSAPGGEEVAFGFSAKNDGGTLRGTCHVIDRTAGVRLRCLDVIAFIRTGSGSTAMIFGHAEVGGVSTSYRLDVLDGGEPGEGQDAFAITTGSGYAAGGVLTRGNVQVR